MNKLFQNKSIPFYTTIAFIAVLALLYYFNSNFQEFIDQGYEVLTNEKDGDEEQWINSYGSWGPVFIVLLFLVQMFLIVIPSVLLMLITIMAYGAWKGSIIVLIGILIASTVGYIMGFFLGARSLHNFIEDDTKNKMSFYVSRYGMGAIIISRFSPFLSIDALSFVAGIVHMSYWRFMLATLIGIVPLIGAIIYFGEQRDKIEQGAIWFSIVSLIGFGAFIWWDRKKRANAKKKSHKKNLSYKQK